MSCCMQLVVVLIIVYRFSLGRPRGTMRVGLLRRCVLLHDRWFSSVFMKYFVFAAISAWYVLSTYACVSVVECLCMAAGSS